MGIVKFHPTRLDRAAARAGKRLASKRFEKALQIVTYAADEKPLLTATAGMWLCSRFGSQEHRQVADYIALTMIAGSLVPHLIKRVVDQQRPDRQVRAPRHGIPRSGEEFDAFPSGHAAHVGVIAAIISRLEPRFTKLSWGLASLIAATRVLLLAHWLSDVLAGLAVGALLEQFTSSFWDPHIFDSERQQDKRAQ